MDKEAAERSTRQALEFIYFNCRGYTRKKYLIEISLSSIFMKGLGNYINIYIMYTLNLT